MDISICVYIMPKQLLKNGLVRLLYPRSGDSLSQKIFLAPSADKEPATMTQSAHSHNDTYMTYNLEIHRLLLLIWFSVKSYTNTSTLIF